MSTAHGLYFEHTDKRKVQSALWLDLLKMNIGGLSQTCPGNMFHRVHRQGHMQMQMDYWYQPAMWERRDVSSSSLVQGQIERSHLTVLHKWYTHTRFKHPHSTPTHTHTILIHIIQMQILKGISSLYLKWGIFCLLTDNVGRGKSVKC